jgi:hypothetical protein
MTPDERRGFEQQMQTLDDAGLRRLLILEESQYRPDVVDVARDELVKRKLPVLSPAGYWKQFPVEWMAAVGFCYSCWVETTDESPGPTVTINLIGTRLLGRGNPCSTCGAIVQAKWLCVVVPVVRLGRYKVIYAKRHVLKAAGYIGRRLK